MENYILQSITKYYNFAPLSMLILHMFSIPYMLIWLKTLIPNHNVTRSKCKQVITEPA